MKPIESCSKFKLGEAQTAATAASLSALFAIIESAYF
jgi:hypothetical protein